MFGGDDAMRAALTLLAAFALITLAAIVWRSAAQDGVFKFSLRHWSGLLLGCAATLTADEAAALKTKFEAEGATVEVKPA